MAVTKRKECTIIYGKADSMKKISGHTTKPQELFEWPNFLIKNSTCPAYWIRQKFYKNTSETPAPYLDILERHC